MFSDRLDSNEVSIGLLSKRVVMKCLCFNKNYFPFHVDAVKKVAYPQLKVRNPVPRQYSTYHSNLSKEIEKLGKQS